MKNTSRNLIKIILGVLVLCVVAVGIFAAATRPRVADQSVTVFAMDTVMSVQYRDTNDGMNSAIEDRITGLEARLSTTDAESEIARLNREGTAQLSDDALSLLTTALDLCRETEGALDISIYPIVKAWGFTTESYRVPGDDEIAALLKNVDYSRIKIDGNTVTIPEGMQIDLGAVAKGFTGDMLVMEMTAAGLHDSVVINLGGNVQTIGAKADGSAWRVAIEDPAAPENYLGVVEVVDKAVITSGGYERFFEENGVTYWHIMNPATGRPADSGLVSVTIVGDSNRGVMCDALSTALFTMGLDRAADYWRSHGDFDMVLVTEDSGVYITPGLADSYKQLATGYTLTVLEK